MGRPGIDRGGRAALDDPAEIHDRDLVRDMADQREVVADDQIGQAQFTLQVAEQVDHLALDGDVEPGSRFVRHDEFRRQSQRPCDADPTCLAAAQLMRVASGESSGQADQIEQPRRLLAADRHRGCGG